MIINKYKLFLYSLFYFTPMVDALNGYMIFNHILLEGGIFSPTQFFRFYLTIFSLLFLTKKQLFIFLFFVFYIFLIEYISFLLHGNAIGVITGFIYGYKLIYIMVIFYAIYNISTKIDVIEIIKFFVYGAFIYGVILLFSIILGISEPTYTEGTFGNKGLFSSGNGLSIYLGTSSLLAFFYYKKIQEVREYLVFVTIFIASLAVGTKATIVFLFVILLMLFFYHGKLIKLLLLLLLFCFFMFFYNKFFIYFSTIFDVIVFRYHNSDNIFSFIASNRNNYVSEALEHFNIEGWAVLRFIFGAGVFLSFRDYSDVNLVYDTLESDFFDVFFSFGLLGLFLYLGVFLISLFKIVRKFNLIVFLGWVILFSYSLIAGHVLFNAMSSMTLIIFYLIILRNDT
jgi:hypothetical protein